MAISTRPHRLRTWHWTPTVSDSTVTHRGATGGIDAADRDSWLRDRPELQIRNLLDDPRLRQSMGLDTPADMRPEARFDRRRLLEQAAA